MTGSSSKLLQIQGKMVPGKKTKKKQNLRQEKQKLFYTQKPSPLFEKIATKY